MVKRFFATISAIWAGGLVGMLLFWFGGQLVASVSQGLVWAAFMVALALGVAVGAKVWSWVLAKLDEPS